MTTGELFHTINHDIVVTSARPVSQVMQVYLMLLADSILRPTCNCNAVAWRRGPLTRFLVDRLLNDEESMRKYVDYCTNTS